MVYEVDRKDIVEYGSLKKAINEGCYTIWNEDKIKSAFKGGNGTIKDFERYKEDNKHLAVFKMM